MREKIVEENEVLLYIMEVTRMYSTYVDEKMFINGRKEIRFHVEESYEIPN